MPQNKFIVNTLIRVRLLYGTGSSVRGSGRRRRAFQDAGLWARTG